MSTFQVPVIGVTIEPHPDPEATQIELARVKGYVSVVKKGQFQTGDLVAYIPEDSIVPMSILHELNLVKEKDGVVVGALAGRDGTRLRAIRLRKALSQGICYPARSHWVEGMDVAEELGITKWEPEIPSQMAGDVWFAGSDRTLPYDVENYKNYPNVLQNGEPVQFTEKIHGSNSLIGIVPKNYAHSEHGHRIVASKGLGNKGLALKLNDANENNLYIRAARQNDVFSHLEKVFGDDTFVFLQGEVFGGGVQDLTYGYDAGKNMIGYRVFDIYVGKPREGRYLNDDEVDEVLGKLGLPRVPVLYRGPFSVEVMQQYTDGKETVSGKEMHIREGIVMKPLIERQHDELGRVMLKSVSGNYLCRKGNTTEYQ